MMYYYTLFTIFSVVVVLMATDQSVSQYIFLLSKIVKNNLDRFYWMVRFHPALFSSPIVKWWMMRKYMRTAEKLAQEISKKGSDGV